jgi:hypothetical protein
MATTAAEIRAQILKDSQALFNAASALDRASKPYTAILIEPRKHRAVAFVLQNLLDCLDQTEWSLIYYHGSSHAAWANQILETLTPEQQARITLCPCPTDSFDSSAAYSYFVASREFLQQIPTETFLIAQTDSMINPARAADIGKFLNYDYIGAPWPWDHLQVGNGGFSLRRKSVMLKVLDSFGPLKGPYEDQFFSFCLQQLKANIPTKEVAREFAVEQLFHPNPFAFHKVWDHMPTRFDDLCEVCPGLRTLKSLQATES